MTVTFGGLDPAPETDKDQASEFLWELHKQSPGNVVVTRIHDDPHKVRSFDGPLITVMGVLREHMDTIAGDDEWSWQVYVGVATHYGRPAFDTDGGARGGIDSVCAVPGMWADLDVKPGGFESQADILSFLESLPVKATMAVDSGSGGIHAYWLFNHAPLDRQGGIALAEMWYVYLEETAELLGVEIDDTSDVDRILRVPGTIRWPKLNKGEMCSPTLVRLLWADGPRYHWKELERLSQPSWRRGLAATARTRSAVHITDMEASSALKGMSLDGIADVSELDWVGEGVLQMVAHWYADNHTWVEVFKDTGWTPVLDRVGAHKGDRHGRLFWARPGQTDKSAVTLVEDEREVPVMALHSKARETGLLELKKAGIQLTKFRVRAQLKYEGDVLRLARETLKEMEHE